MSSIDKEFWGTVSRAFHVTREKQDPRLFTNTQTCKILCASVHWSEKYMLPLLTVFKAHFMENCKAIN